MCYSVGQLYKMRSDTDCQAQTVERDRWVEYACNRLYQTRMPQYESCGIKFIYSIQEVCLTIKIRIMPL